MEESDESESEKEDESESAAEEEVKQGLRMSDKRHDRATKSALYWKKEKKKRKRNWERKKKRNPRLSVLPSVMLV